ncbi:MAG: hypothetical protein LBD99_01020, partial [Candidatus Margulisbacteria bacterium]|nr:hypothetical protein [Candidatus Margulisiibacteriota bacterium]
DNLSELPPRARKAVTKKLEKLLKTPAGLQQLARYFSKLSHELQKEVIDAIINLLNGDRSKLASLNLPAGVLKLVEQELEKQASPAPAQTA